jgi:hypothetical protein
MTAAQAIVFGDNSGIFQEHQLYPLDATKGRYLVHALD